MVPMVPDGPRMVPGTMLTGDSKMVPQVPMVPLGDLGSWGPSLFRPLGADVPESWSGDHETPPLDGKF